MSSRKAFVVILFLASSVTFASAAEKILLDGSTGMLPLASALAKAYQQKSTDPELELGKGLGTGARLRAVADGKIQIALASHGIETAEVQKRNLKVIPVAKGAIVFAVNSVPLSNITEEQVRRNSYEMSRWFRYFRSTAPDDNVGFRVFG
jgi:phosphate transport system substrate-binding protein